MNTRTHQLMQAREAGRAGWPCPVAEGDTSPEGLALFHAWLIALTEHETGATIMPQAVNANGQHPDLFICRPKPPKEDAL